MIFLLLLTLSLSGQAQDTTFVPFRHEIRYIGSSVSIDQNYQYILYHLSELLQRDTTLRVHIRGHVCCGPGEKISRKRAKKVYRYLERDGVRASQMTYKGYSNTAPARFPEKKEEDEAANRRVDFILFRLE